MITVDHHPTGLLKTAKSVGFQYPTTLRLFHIGYVVGVFYGLLLSLVLTARENYYSDASMISTIVLGVILSETGLFVSFFWAVYNTSWTTGLDLECLCLPDPSSIVLYMTIMLSALSIVVSSVYLKNQHMYTSCTNIMTFTLVVAFLMLVGTEYLGLSMYINDNGFGNTLFLLTGLHFTHVLVGAILVFFNQGIYSSLVTYLPTSCITLSKSKGMLCKIFTEPFTILYLHFVETLWILIHVTFYV